MPNHGQGSEEDNLAGNVASHPDRDPSDNGPDDIQDCAARNQENGSEGNRDSYLPRDSGDCGRSDSDNSLKGNREYNSQGCLGDAGGDLHEFDSTSVESGA